MAGYRVRALSGDDREIALVHLGRQSRLNLPLIELAMRLGKPKSPPEPRCELIGAFDAGRLVAVASLQPSVLLDASAGPEALEALFPQLAGVGTGLVKSKEEVVDPLWEWLSSRGRRALLDRIEIGYELHRGADLPAVDDRVQVRSARAGDLEPLVEAARASLREENRPDAFRGDPGGFRRWVRSRLARATVVESAGEVVFVGYADVQCPAGWLLQGVYTWPAHRRAGYARQGVGQLCRQAFASGADHVQLAVVEGNRSAEALYTSLGFRAYGRLRTLLFA